MTTSLFVLPRPFSALRRFACIPLLVGIAGCASLQDATSGQIGCAASDIKITNDASGWNTRTWTAQCHGHTYYCSAIRDKVDCKKPDEETTTNDSDRTTDESGCHFDAQCKGDRVCRNGDCVDH
jgi:hypothetical protein